MVHSAEQILVNVSKGFPGAWKAVTDVRSATVLPWPDWCFMPLDYWKDIAVVAGEIGSKSHREKLKAFLISLPALAAVGTWRYSKGVYRYDRDLYEAIIATPLNGDLPAELFYRLPEFCVYIETPGMTFSNGVSAIRGMFVHLDHSATDGVVDLRFLLDAEASEGEEQLPVPMAIQLGPWTIEEGLSRMLIDADNTGVRYEVRGQNGEPLSSANAVEKQALVRHIATFMRPLLSLVLYLCAEERDVTSGGAEEAPLRPTLTRTSKGAKLFPVDKVKTWDVGYRIGPRLRAAREKSEESGGVREAHTKRPHIRKAHWHTFWRGPRSEQRIPFVKWLPPIPINVDDVDSLPLVERLVVDSSRIK